MSLAVQLLGTACWLSGAHSVKIHVAGGSVSPVVFLGEGSLVNSGPRQHSQASPCWKQLA